MTFDSNYHPVMIPFYWQNFLSLVETGVKSSNILSIIIDHSTTTEVHRGIEEGIDQFLSGLPGVDYNQLFIMNTPMDSRPEEIFNLVNNIYKGVLIIDPATFNSMRRSGQGMGRCLSGDRIVLHRDGFCTYYRTRN